MGRDHFEVLGVPRAYHVDLGALESRYLALQKETHPDRYTRALPRERLEAVVRNTELNDAWRVLKNDFKRAEYILRLEGLDIGDERPKQASGQTRQLVVDPQLLIEVMELREALAEACVDGDEAKVGQLVADVRARSEEARRAVDEGFTAWEKGDTGKLEAIARALVSLRYYARFMDEAESKE